MKKPPSEPRYPHPFVECDEHPGPQRGYIACKHVLRGADIGTHFHASDTEIGQLLCRPCAKIAHKLTADELLLVCGSHVKEMLAARRRIQ